MPWDSLNGGRWCDRSYEGLIRAVAGAKELITDVERRIQDERRGRKFGAYWTGKIGFIFLALMQALVPSLGTAIALHSINHKQTTMSLNDNRV